MEIPDRAKAEEYLCRIGYYRLSAFWYPFRNTGVAPDGNAIVLDTFKPGTSFKTAVDLYAFDKTLRMIVTDAIERVEIGIRTQVALQLGQYDPWSHRNSAFFDRRFISLNPKTGEVPHVSWLAKLDNKAFHQKRNSQSISGLNTH